LKAFMLRGTGAYASFMKAGPELRELVRFRRVNLHDDSMGAEAPFDVIFCRNVLIYFSPEGRARVVDRLVDCLAGDGYLFVGHAETLSGISGRLGSVEPTIYSTRGAGSAARRHDSARPPHRRLPAHPSSHNSSRGYSS
jgi:chemotaxis protein methyltransferase CheR